MTCVFAQVANAQNAASQCSDHASIEGTVTGDAHKPAGGATVHLEKDSLSTAIETKTNAQGVFTFSGLSMGSYTLTAENSGSRSGPSHITVSSPNEKTQVELLLKNEPSAQNATEPAMEFADKPNFTIAGVTDWTAVGGHGSDSILRTSESLARETLLLRAANANTVSGDAAGPSSRAHVADSLRLKAEAAEKQGDSLAAVHGFEQAARLDPSEQNSFEWGSELLLHRAVWQAQEVFSKGAEAYPKSARMSAALGAALFASARYDEAALRLCTASDLDPSDPEPYEFMGKIAIVSPTSSACVEQKLARFVQQQPGSSLANYLYAMAILKRQSDPMDQQTLGQVKRLLEKAVAIDPRCSDGYLQLGILALSERNLDKAMEFFTKAIEADPESGEAHYRLGVAYDRKGRSADAEKEFKLHDEIERQDAARIEQQRREVKQFLIVLNAQPNAAPHGRAPQ